MKKSLQNPFLLPALIAGLCLIPAGRVTAQTFTTLHSLTGNDGINPKAGLILSGGTLYGAAYQGGSSGNGTIFAVNTNGTGFRVLHSFTPVSGNTDGADPYAGLILSGDTLYGTARFGGSGGKGTVFSVNTNGAGFTTLHSFTAVSADVFHTNSDGATPYAGLILSGNTLYGTAGAGGNGKGVVFAVNTNGTGFTNLHSFTGFDGSLPQAGLILSGGTLYGTTVSGGDWFFGTVFALFTNGTGFVDLHNFTETSGSRLTNSDGANPYGGLILSGNTLYGTANAGGRSGQGAVFKINTNGADFTNLYSFTFGGNDPFCFCNTNSDGANPYAQLVLSGNTLYGTAEYGGSSGGTVFAINIDGTLFTNLHTFTNGSDGANPYGGLILSGSALYGTAYYGGSFGNGTIFSVSVPPPPPRLAIILDGANIVLTWPTNAAGFALQFTTNLASPVIWNSNASAPAVVNAQNAVTNLISSPQKIYRLIQ